MMSYRFTKIENESHFANHSYPVSLMERNEKQNLNMNFHKQILSITLFEMEQFFYSY